MRKDRDVADLRFIPETTRARLNTLEIRTLRQLAARLTAEGNQIQEYLRLSDQKFAALRRRVERLIQGEFPEDALARVHPPVNKRGVAVHRLKDPARPKYYDEDSE